LQQWDVRREFLRRLKAAFDAHGIEIPYPHLTVYAGQDKNGGAPAWPLRLIDGGE
jgi:small conductance mechanosensitive channel